MDPQPESSIQQVQPQPQQPPIPTNNPTDPVKPIVMAPDGTPFIPGPWDPGVAAKKVAWGLGKLGVSVSLSPTLAPGATAAIEKLSAILTPYGISIHVNQAVFDKALPFLIFAALAAGLDFAKMKTKIPWL